MISSLHVIRLAEDFMGCNRQIIARNSSSSSSEGENHSCLGYIVMTKCDATSR